VVVIKSRNERKEERGRRRQREGELKENVR
jgi:hypothetical protein